MSRRTLAPLTERLVTLEQAADLLQVSPVTVRRMVSRSELRAYRVGRFIRFDPADLARACQPIPTYPHSA